MFAFAGVALNPMIASAAMSLSSLFVVTNALRLTRFMKKKEPAGKAQELPNEINEKGDTTMQTTLKIEGMMCQHCVKHVTDALKGIAGVTAVEVSLEKKQAVVTHAEVCTKDALKAAVVDAGYEVVGIA